MILHSEIQQYMEGMIAEAANPNNLVPPSNRYTNEETAAQIGGFIAANFVKSEEDGSNSYVHFGRQDVVRGVELSNSTLSPYMELLTAGKNPVVLNLGRRNNYRVGRPVDILQPTDRLMSLVTHAEAWNDAYEFYQFKALMERSLGRLVTERQAHRACSRIGKMILRDLTATSEM